MSSYCITKPCFATESLINNQFAEFCKKHPTYASVALDWKFVIIKYLGQRHTFRMCFNINGEDEDRIRVWENSVHEIIFSLISFNKEEKDKYLNYNNFVSRYKTLLDQSNYIYSEREKELILMRAYLKIRDEEEEKESYNIIELVDDLMKEFKMKRASNRNA